VQCVNIIFRLVIAGKYQFINKVNVISCAGAALSAAAGTTAELLSNL